MTRPRPAGRPASIRAAGLSLVLLFLVLHAPYLPASLEDLDSINFALGMRQFDVAHHQPHPPGYPIFILAADLTHRVISPEARALGLLSVLAGALGVVAIVELFRLLGGATGGGDAIWTVAGTTLAMTSPLYWFTAARPLSDAAGLAAAIGVQALTLGAETPLVWYAAAFGAGLAAGIRSQAVWLTGPLLILCATKARNKGTSLKGTAAAFAAGVLVWLVPLVALSGGMAAYWRALFNQGAEDLGGVRMLWTTPTPRALLDALYFAFVAPWAVWQVAVALLAVACVGCAALFRLRPGTLLIVTVAFGPYMLFDILFQETVTGRYALPLVVPIAFLAAEGLRQAPRYPAIVIAAAVAMFNAHLGGTSIAAYSRQQAPAFRLLADMARTQADEANAAAGTAPVGAPVAAMDRREDLDLRRPLVWMGAAAPRFERRLPAPPQHEWLELVKYWNSGGTSPAWFVADPLRTDVHLVQHADPKEYRWALPYPVLLSGIRPNEMDWYRLSRPEWYVGEGWALTPEAAGVAEAEHRGLPSGPIEAWVRTDVFAGAPTLLIGGRNFEPTTRPRVTVSTRSFSRPGTLLADRIVKELTVAPGAFLDVVRLPLIDFGAGMPNYIQLDVNATPQARVAIEQFDVSAARPVLGFGEGWAEQEYNAVTGKRWRWLSDHGALLIGNATRDGSATGDIELRLEGESPLRYFSRGSRLIVRAGTAASVGIRAGIAVDTRAGIAVGTRAGTTVDTHAGTAVDIRAGRAGDPSAGAAGDTPAAVPNDTGAGAPGSTGAAATGIGSKTRVVFDRVLSSDFSLAIRIADPADVILLETDQTYVPAERSWRPTRDRRRLGLRIFRCELRRLP